MTMEVGNGFEELGKIYFAQMLREFSFLHDQLIKFLPFNVLRNYVYILLCFMQLK